MTSVVGILNSRAEMELVVGRLRSIGLKDDRINVLTPDAREDGLSKVPTAETEQPGAASAIGGVVGGVLGAASGMSLGTAVSSFVIPGVGPVLAIGLAAAAFLGFGGAAGGVAVGKALDDSMAAGLPIDDLFVYDDALRQGRTVVIAFAEDLAQAEQAREIMREVGAESVDAARESWWVGLRDDAQVGYTKELDNIEHTKAKTKHLGSDQ